MILWRRYEAILFDLEGVIARTATLHATAWKRVLDEFLAARSGVEGRPFLPFDAEGDYPRYMDGRARGDGVADFLASRGIDLPLGHQDDPPDAHTCWGLGHRKSAYLEEGLSAGGVEVFHDALTLFGVLEHAGKQLALVSFAEDGQLLVDRAGLLDRFPDGVVDREGRRDLPAAPDELLAAAERVGVRPSQAIVVAATAAGVRAGEAGGFGLVVGVDRQGSPDRLAATGADVVVRDLRELVTMEDPPLVRETQPPLAAGDTATLFEAIVLVPPAGGFAHDPVLSRELDEVVARLRERGVDVVVTEQEEDVAKRVGRTVDAAHQRGVGPGLVLATGWLRNLELPAGAERVSVVSVLQESPAGGLPPSMHSRDGGGSACLALLRQQADRWDAGLVPGVDHDPGWTVTIHGDDPRQRRAHQSLLTVADTRFGTRGVREEDGLGSLPLVLAVGVFDNTATPPTLLAGPTWTGLDLLEPVDTRRDRRTLDLRGGVLFRESSGEPVPLRTLRFASLARPGCFAMRAEGGVEWLRTSQALIPPANDGTFVRTQRGDLSHAHADTGAGGLIAAATVQRERHAGGRRVVDRLAFYAADPDGRPMLDAAKAGLTEADRLGFDALLREHRSAWARRWDDALVCIDGDPDLELAVRFSLFQLMASVPTDGEAAVGARGVSGPSYRGHVFWDADVFALPFFAATCPPAARAMLEYRLRRLGPAYRAAAERGLRGARFPWESARGGEDVTPRWDTPPHGPPIRIYTGEHEEHIVADVAWAAWQYAAWTGDRGFLQGPGRPLLLDTARYWASRISVDADGRGHIDDVIGPDEYHERVDDNVFTNVMARWNLRRAAELAHDAPGRDGVAPGEIDEWRRLADASSTTTTPTRGGTSSSGVCTARAAGHQRPGHGARRGGPAPGARADRPLTDHQAAGCSDAPPRRPRGDRAGLPGAEPGVLRATLRPRQFLVARRARGVVRPRRPPRRRPRALPPGVPARPGQPHRDHRRRAAHRDVRRRLAGPGLRLPGPATAPRRAARRPTDPRSLGTGADEAAVPRGAAGRPGLGGRRPHHQRRACRRRPASTGPDRNGRSCRPRRPGRGAALEARR